LFKDAITANLTPDLLQPKYRELNKRNPLFGHCYVATEAMYYLLGGKESGYKPCVIRLGDTTHWFLKHKITEEIIDITAEQFDFPVPYEKGRGNGFLTKNPSKRTQELLKRIEEK
jgi:hypothetical protein